MGKRAIIIRITLCLIILLVCTLLTGCPNKPSSDYESIIKDTIELWYGIEFSNTVRIEYQLPDGTKKTAVFKLDGYDNEKEIGYQIVTKEDKTQWEKERSNGNINAPDLNDDKLIQSQALRYKFPVIFICIYDYQDDSDWDEIIDNQYVLIDEIKNIFNTPEMIQWVKEGAK